MLPRKLSENACTTSGWLEPTAASTWAASDGRVAAITSFGTSLPRTISPGPKNGSNSGS